MQVNCVFLFTDVLRWIPDAVQLYRFGENGTLAFHARVDSYLIHIYNGNRKDERGNTILKTVIPCAFS